MALKDIMLKTLTSKPEPVEMIDWEQLARQLEYLGAAIDGEETRKVEYTYKGKSLVARGIPEDFKILLDNQVVCEFVYGSVYNINESLLKEILD